MSELSRRYKAWLRAMASGRVVDAELRDGLVQAMAGDEQMEGRLDAMLRGVAAEPQLPARRARWLGLRQTTPSGLAKRIDPLEDARQWDVTDEHNTPLSDVLQPPPGTTYLMLRGERAQDPKRIWWFEPGTPTSGVAMVRTCRALQVARPDDWFVSADHLLRQPESGDILGGTPLERVAGAVQGIRALLRHFPDAELRVVGASMGASCALLMSQELRLERRVDFYLIAAPIPGATSGHGRRIAALVKGEVAAQGLPGIAGAATSAGLALGISMLTLAYYPPAYRAEMMRYHLRAIRVGLARPRVMAATLHWALELLEDGVAGASPGRLREALAFDERLHYVGDPIDAWADPQIMAMDSPRVRRMPGLGHAPLELPEPDERMVRWLLE
ncbi:MAG: hypothetical protein H6740_12430 [Alphaproteobacteria bacterium]|nr:hypothetical protein [Alphaproteobacteria bacterium]